jgi:hypothetical protein
MRRTPQPPGNAVAGNLQRRTLAEEVRDLAAPLASGIYVADWAERAGAIAALVDVSAPSAREDAYRAPESPRPSLTETPEPKLPHLPGLLP